MDTDGGAHRRAWEWWGSDKVPLDAIAEAMIRFSGNASADYLLDRVATDGVVSFARRTSLVAQDPILPVLGEFRAWHRSSAQWIALLPVAALELMRRVLEVGGVSDDPSEKRSRRTRRSC